MTNNVDILRRRTTVRWRWRIFLGLACIGVAALVWYWSPLHARAQAGVSYSARIACSCRYVAGRDVDDCRKDLPPGMSLMMLSDNEEEQSVTARLLPITSETAFYREGQGCVLERYSR